MAPESYSIGSTKVTNFIVGDIQLYKSNMIRYYKLTFVELGINIFDYSNYEKHFKFNEISEDLSIFVSDDEMDRQIAFASTSEMQITEQETLCEDDFSTNFRRIRLPMWPKTFTVLHIEFWFKFNSIASNTQDPDNFHIKTVPSIENQVCYQMQGFSYCQSYQNKVSNLNWQSYILIYDNKTPLWRSALDNEFNDATPPFNTGKITPGFKACKFSFQFCWRYAKFRKIPSYPGAGLIGYWPLQRDSYGNDYLSDESINPQTIHLDAPVKFCQDPNSLVLCEFGYVYVEIQNYCVQAIATSVEYHLKVLTLPTQYGSNQVLCNKLVQ
ncbi:UNKNOWN [Stylonychia lemnae]|uniref:Uncharacterized protein n=1 Tax=Stylonychia lemnae TaxID=5949 RepID=A0A078AS39_STYLE|nr:UNKNOWN [Stylonychia lemnae]|eukprot:CDW84027.1 UNKNOWN [Stylonychia lemnae]